MNDCSNKQFYLNLLKDANETSVIFADDTLVDLQTFKSNMHVFDTVRKNIEFAIQYNILHKIAKYLNEQVLESTEDDPFWIDIDVLNEEFDDVVDEKYRDKIGFGYILKYINEESIYNKWLETI